MEDFQFIAREKGSDKTIKGTIQAQNEAAAAKLLQEKNLYALSITKKQTGILGGLNLSFLNGVRAKDRVIFTRQLATLVKAGLPIAQALSTATEQISNKNFKNILNKIKAAVEGGSSLANAFGQYPAVFNHIYISLVRSGESSGTLDETLERLALQQEKELQLVAKIRGALIYPSLVLIVILAVISFMLVTVLPQIKLLYSDLRKTLPILTRILLALSDFAAHFWWLLFLLLVALVFGLRAYIRTPKGRYRFDKFKLSAPPFKTLFTKVYMARFSRTLGSLVSSGVPILEALNIVSISVGNVVIKEGIDQAAVEVKGGKALSTVLSKNPYFLSLVPQMIKIGEDSGTLDEMLERVANFYDDEVDQTVKNLSTLFEPLLMIGLGVLVFGIILAVLFPIYSLVGGGLETNPNPTTAPISGGK